MFNQIWLKDLVSFHSMRFCAYAPIVPMRLSLRTYGAYVPIFRAFPKIKYQISSYDVIYIQVQKLDTG